MRLFFTGPLAPSRKIRPLQTRYLHIKRDNPLERTPAGCSGGSRAWRDTKVRVATYCAGESFRILHISASFLDSSSIFWNWSETGGVLSCD